MKSTPGAEGATLGSSRDTTIERLCEHFANDALDVAEFERRVDVAHKAESLKDLEVLLADLPTEKAVVPSRRKAPSTAPVSPPRAALAAPSVRYETVPPEAVRERQLAVGILGGASRAGAWIPARQVFTAAVMGGVELDFREARFGPGITEVTAFALCGGIGIVVPPGLQVECNGVGIMGAFVHEQDLPMQPDPDAPFLRINGVALMGGVEVTVRLPGESPREARRRRKLAKREQKRLAKGS